MQLTQMPFTEAKESLGTLRLPLAFADPSPQRTVQLDLSSLRGPAVIGESSSQIRELGSYTSAAPEHPLNEHDSPPLIGSTELAAALVVSITLYAQIKYIKQIRSGVAAKSMASMGLNFINDSLLALTALYNMQGLPSIAMMSTYAFMDAIMLYEIYRRDKSNSNLTFSKFDLACALTCAVGWYTLYGPLPEQINQFLTDDSRAFSASVIAILVNVAAALPLIIDNVVKPVAKEDLAPMPEKRCEQFKKKTEPVIPWLLDSVAYSIALITSPMERVSGWLQPLAIWGTNIFVIWSSYIYGGRRLQKEDQ